MTVFSITAFREFCASRPEAEEYLYWASPLGRFWPVPMELRADYAKASEAERSEPHTFGALTDRLDALLEAAS